MNKFEEFIKRKDALNEIHRFRGYIDEDMECRMKLAINRIQSVDVAPIRRATWKTYPLHFKYCSLCNEPSWFVTNFCPNCGADMSGGI